MIEIFSRKTGLQAGLLVRWVYFAPGIIASAAKRDIDVYSQCNSPIMDSTLFRTVSVDLSQDEDILFMGLNQGHRRKIRQAVNRENLVVDINFTPTNEDIESLRSFYNVFAASQGLSKANVPQLKSLRNAGCLSIASVRRDNENLPLAMHSFISDGYRVLGHISNTLPRTKDNGILLGQANRLLQWKAMLAMKKADMKIYDFGGISPRPELQGINDYKRQFGGIESEEYCAIYGVSSVGKLALKTSSLLDRFTKRT